MGYFKKEYLYDYKLEEIKKKLLENKFDNNKEKIKLIYNFSDLPISQRTLKSLIANKFITLTQIQRCSIIHSLVGRNMVIASKTGSGKTLSYLIPVIENLYRKKWSKFDGLGGLILVPTRELAIQVFEVLKLLLANHEINATVIYGGKKLEDEQKFIHNTNILIATPGRLLQHLEETVDFYYDNLEMFVIDEVDEIMDLGFENTMKSIINNLKIVNSNKQILSFSATLGKNTIGNKFGLENELKNAEFILLHEKNKGSVKNLYEVPLKLEQYYTEVDHHEKLNKLFSFLKSHKKSKVLVFVSTCKQVRFIYETFKKLKVGSSILELHGRQKQSKRTAIYYSFLEKHFGSLITTNVVSRGLDFPNINWVVQYDCPESVEVYVHRIGRTARHKSGGRSLLFLDKSELTFSEKLIEANLVIKKIGINPNKKLEITNSLKSILAENSEIKYLAQKAFISFFKNVYHMQDKSVFNISKINGNLLTKSFGLIQTPVIRIGGAPNNKNVEYDKIENLEEKEFIEEKQNTEEQDDKLPMNKKQRKLEKLKQKIRDKKNLDKNKEVVIPEKNKNNILSKSRINPELDRTDKILEKEESDDEFLFKKKVPQVNLDEIQISNKKYSRNELKRIRKEGINRGENVEHILDDGQIVDNEQYFKNKLKNTQDNDKSLINAIGSKLIINEIKDKEEAQERLQSKKIKKKQYKKEYLSTKRDGFY